MVRKVVSKTKSIMITVSSRGTNTYVKDRGKWKNTKMKTTKPVKKKK